MPLASKKKIPVGKFLDPALGQGDTFKPLSDVTVLISSNLASRKDVEVKGIQGSIIRCQKNRKRSQCHSHETEFKIEG